MLCCHGSDLVRLFINDTRRSGKCVVDNFLIADVDQWRQKQDTSRDEAEAPEWYDFDEAPREQRRCAYLL